MTDKLTELIEGIVGLRHSISEENAALERLEEILKSRVKDLEKCNELFPARKGAQHVKMDIEINNYHISNVKDAIKSNQSKIDRLDAIIAKAQ